MTDFSDLGQITNLVKKTDWTPAEAQEVFRNLSTLLATLSQNTGWDDSSPIPISRGEPWDLLAAKFFALGELNVAEIVYSVWLKQFYDAQTASGRRFHKGGPLHQIGVIYSLRDRPDTARRFFLLAFVEDMLSDSARMREYPSYNVLRHVIRMPEETLKSIQAAVATKLGQKVPVFYPEEILLDHTLQTASSAYRPWDYGSPVLNSEYASELWDTVAKARKPKEKGTTLEKLLAYLVETSEGLELAGANVLTHEYELDLLVRNLIVDDPLFEELGAYILIECKNWDTRVDVVVISHFVEKLRSTRCRTGILVARRGITGEQLDLERNRVEAARLSVLKAHHQDGVVVVVLDETGLRKIVRGEATLRSILMLGYESIRFDKKRAQSNPESTVK